MEARLVKHGTMLAAWGTTVLVGFLRSAETLYPTSVRRLEIWDQARILAMVVGDRVQVRLAQEPVPDVMDERQFLVQLQAVDRAYALELLKEGDRITGRDKARRN
jgi:hypothetical protein